MLVGQREVSPPAGCTLASRRYTQEAVETPVPPLQCSLQTPYAAAAASSAPLPATDDLSSSTERSAGTSAATEGGGVRGKEGFFPVRGGVEGQKHTPLQPLLSPPSKILDMGQVQNRSLFCCSFRFSKIVIYFIYWHYLPFIQICIII